MGKKYLLWFLVVVYLGFGAISVFHTIEFWEITNEKTYAIVLAVVNSIAIVSAIWISFYSKFFSRLIFGVTFTYEVFGNIFYSYHWLNENIGSKFFIYWCDLNQWIYELISSDPNMDIYHGGMKIVTAWLQGAIVPTLQAIIFYALIKLIPTPEIETPNESIEPPVPDTPDIPELENIPDTIEPQEDTTPPVSEAQEIPIEPTPEPEPPIDAQVDEVEEDDAQVDTIEVDDTQVDEIKIKDPIGGKIINKKLYNQIKDDFKAQFKDIVNENPSELEKNIQMDISEKGKQWKLKKD